VNGGDEGDAGEAVVRAVDNEEAEVRGSGLALPGSLGPALKTKTGKTREGEAGEARS